MAKNTLYNKVWDSHVVARLPTGQYQLFIGLHLAHEVTTAQGFENLRERGMQIPFLDRTIATVDHIIPTDGQPRPYADPQADLNAGVEYRTHLAKVLTRRALTEASA